MSKYTYKDIRELHTAILVFEVEIQNKPASALNMTYIESMFQASVIAGLKADDLTRQIMELQKLRT